jgi:hypothetical protein
MPSRQQRVVREKEKSRIKTVTKVLLTLMIKSFQANSKEKKL